MAFIQKIENKGGTRYKVHYADPATGKRRGKNFTRRKDAQHFLENVPKNTYIHDRDSVSVDTAVDRWLAVCEKYGRRGREPVEAVTLRKYKLFARYIKSACGSETVARLTPARCQAICNDFLDNHRRPTARKILTAFKGMLAQAVTEGWIATNPARDVNITASTRDGAGREPAIPSLDEVRLLLRAADRLAAQDNKQLKRQWARYRALFYTMAYTGMRPGEALGLPRSNIDLRALKITISQDLNEDLTIGRPKSRAGYRTVHIPPDLAQILREWIIAAPKSSQNLVFCNWRGKPESASNVTGRGWRGLQEAAGIIEKGKPLKYPMKSLRHVRASLEIASGASPLEIKKLMGHSSIKVTYDVYGHLFPEDESHRVSRAGAVANLLART
jgi:integrase